MTKNLATLYAGFLGRIDAILDTRGFEGQSQDLDYSWYQAFIIG